MQFWLLLEVRIREDLHRMRELKMADIPGLFASFVVFGGFAVGLFLLTRTTTLYLMATLHIGSFLYHRFLGMGLYVLFLAVNLGNIIVCYATLYHSDEVDFLTSLPVAQRTLFAIRFVDNFFSSSSTLLLMGLAAYGGYASAFGIPILVQIASLLLVCFPMMLLAGLTGVIILVMVVGFAVRIGIQRVLVLGILAYGAAICAYFFVYNPIDLVTEVSKHFPAVDAYLGELDPAFVHFMPTHWAVEYFYWAAAGRMDVAGVYALYLCVVTLGVGAVALWVGGEWYYRSRLAVFTFASMRSGAGVRSASHVFSFPRKTFRNTVIDVFAKRDLLSFVRDPSQWMHLLLLLSLVAVFVASMAAFELPRQHPILFTASYLAVMLFNEFLVSSMSLRFVYPAISMEGPASWIVRSSPVPLDRMYRLRYVEALLPVLVVALVLGVVSSLLVREALSLVVLGLVSLVCTSLSLTSLHYGAGTVFAQYREPNPVRVASSRGATFTFLLSLVYLAGLAVFLAGPVFHDADMLLRGRSPSIAVHIVPVASILIVSLAITVGSLRWGLRAFTKDLA